MYFFIFLSLRCIEKKEEVTYRINLNQIMLIDVGLYVEAVFSWL